MQDPMASGEEEDIMNLLRRTIGNETRLRDVAAKLCLGWVGVPMLLESSEMDVEGIIRRVFPEAPVELEMAIKLAIRLQKRNSTDEGARPSKKAKFLSLKERVSARSRYFGKLLEPPAELPVSVNQLKEFLSLTPVKLPVLDGLTYENLGQPNLVVLDTSKGASQLATFCEIVFEMMKHSLPDNEATSSTELCFLTGHFLRFLNDRAPESKQLLSLQFRQDSANRTTANAASQPLEPLLRPDFQLFVKDCLILRWENKINDTLLAEAVDENRSKLKAWSPLFYGKLPYVIGGGFAGRRFQWLKLSPKGKEIVHDLISDEFDLNLPSGVAKFLHSIVRMHCLLQKLQENIDNEIRVQLYKPKEKAGVVVTIHPDCVTKKIPGLKKDRVTAVKLLYDSIVGSRYLIQLVSTRSSGGGTVLQLQPVGDPFALPRDCKDLGNATHDMLHGLADLHGKGYTHRDLRWDNCIKVNDKSHWKWVIIDLEAAGPDNEVWVDEWLFGWDAETLEEDNDKRKRYTKGSDVYQLGKLIAGWLNDFSVGGKEEREVMRSLAKQMQQDRTAASKVLEDVCKKGCERCRMLGTQL